MDKQTVYIKDLGRIDYETAWKMQEVLLQQNVAIKTNARKSGESLDPYALPTTHHFLYCEHDPVYTLGKSGSEANLLFNENQRNEKGISYFKTNRGGDITFHGPGQIVAYPIFDLEKFRTDIGWYLRNLEEAVILLLADYGIASGRSKGETGVWIDAELPGMERKICAIGVRCSRWITMHGIALNINTDLNYFDGIIPCGIRGKQVTSLEKELGRNIDMNIVKQQLTEKLAAVFNYAVK